MEQVPVDAAKTKFNVEQAVVQEAKLARVAKYKSRRMSSKDTIAGQSGEEARNIMSEDIAIIIQSRLVVNGSWLAVDT